MPRLPIRVTRDLRLIGAETATLRPAQGLALAKALVRASVRRAEAEEADLDRRLAEMTQRPGTHPFTRRAR